MSTPVGGFDPQPCGTGGAGGDAVDLENLILCDTLPDGSVVGTALAVYDYSTGNDNAAPTFVNPATGLAYVPQGTLMPCPGDAGCLEPVAFHRTTTSTSPVDHPGRQYDLTLPINPGFAVQSLQVDQVTNAANIVWDVADPDGEQFRQDLTAFIDARIPSSAVVTITNPNAGNTICGTAAPMQIHIECLRLDQNPPNLIELVYNGGQDMVINPAYNETPPLSPPVSQGNYGYHLLARQDDPGPFPGNPPANRANCTNVANRGWETNDTGRTFEIWGQDVAGGVTPTPRGTPIQEITSDGPPPGGRSTIWQTFQAPASGNFIIRVVHGARDAGENHRITLDNGDTDDTQAGTLIDNTTTNVPVVYGNPWTTFNQTIPLVAGSTYTLALSTNNPVGGARGGLFTDMRAYIDRPDLRATAVNDDDTCVVSVNETSTVCTDELWSPICAGGNIDSWQNAQTSVILSNAAFWGQAPAPVPGACPAAAGSGSGGSVAANLAYTYSVCATVGGVRTNLQRVVITDGSGGVLADSFIGSDGGPVPTPSAYTIGSCTDTAFMGDIVLCDVGTPDAQGNPTLFLRKFVQAVSDTGQPQIKAHGDFTADGLSTFTPVGPVGACAGPLVDQEVVCWTQTSTGTAVHTGTMRHDDRLPAPGWLLFDQHQTPVAPTEPGLTFVPCDESVDPISVTGLCLSDGSPIAVVVRRNSVTGIITRDGWINLTTGLFTTGAPPAGTVACGGSQSIQISDPFCDMLNGNVVGVVLIEYHYAPDGTIDSIRYIDATTGVTYVPQGTITVCPGDTVPPDRDMEILCDVNGGVATPFIRDYVRNSSGTVTAVANYTLAGAAYNPTGTVGVCVIRDEELLVLCDSTPTRFLRRYNYDVTTGNLISIVNTTLDGSTAFTPVGAVSVCTTAIASDFDFDQMVMSDANNTCFIRRFTFNSSTGAVTGITNLTLAGAAFAPVGAVTAGCSDCCPAVIGEGCTNTGSGRYTAIRAANGTITLIDSVSGAAVTAGQIIACSGDDTVRTLTAQARQLTNAAPWTPGGDVVGTLTSLTVTGTSGLWDMVDQSGTTLTGLPAGLTLTWSAEDDNQLSGPTSVTPQAGASVVANWTQR